MQVRKTFSIVTLLTLLFTGKGFCQAPTATHKEGVPTPFLHWDISGRLCKTSIDAGLVFGFAGTSGFASNYVSGISAKTGYTFGVLEEIPIQNTTYIDVGVEILQDGVSFNSYFFAPGYSFFVDGAENYNHVITINEIHIPVLFKSRITPIDRKNRSLFMTFGTKFRFLSYTNTTVTSNETGFLVWQGQKDVVFNNKMFSPFGSPIIELGLGYQRNTKKKRTRGWYMSLEYNYGLSSLVYSGNKEGSNYITFRLNTLLFKIGKIF